MVAIEVVLTTGTTGRSTKTLDSKSMEDVHGSKAWLEKNHDFGEQPQESVHGGVGLEKNHDSMSAWDSCRSKANDGHDARSGELWPADHGRAAGQEASRRRESEREKALWT